MKRGALFLQVGLFAGKYDQTDQNFQQENMGQEDWSDLDYLLRDLKRKEIYCLKLLSNVQTSIRTIPYDHNRLNSSK